MTVFECNACNKSSIYTSACTLCNKQKQLNWVNLIFTQKRPSFKKSMALCKMAGVKKVTGGGQEIAVMVGQWQKF